MARKWAGMSVRSRPWTGIHHGSELDFSGIRTNRTPVSPAQLFGHGEVHGEAQWKFILRLVLR